jgi:hypothetical protein
MVSSAARSRVSLAAQALALRSAFPASRPVITRNRLHWAHTLRPAAASCSYDVRLEARPYEQAEVFVTSPALQPDDDGRLPHIYDNGALCLNLGSEWRPTQLFIDTSIPWAMEWLFFYELWLSDRVWRGDGIDPSDHQSQQAILHRYSPPCQATPGRVPQLLPRVASARQP